MGNLLPAVRPFGRTLTAVSWVGCAVDVRTAASPRCRCARVVVLSVMTSSRRVSIAVLVPATRRKGSGNDELVALGVGPLSPVPVVLDHLLLSCRQVSCHPHTLSLQLLLAFGQDVHFVRPLGKLGYDRLWCVVVAVAKAVCTDGVITRPLFVQHGVVQKFQQVFLCKCQSFRCETAGCLNTSNCLFLRTLRVCRFCLLLYGKVTVLLKILHSTICFCLSVSHAQVVSFEFRHLSLNIH